MDVILSGLLSSKVGDGGMRSSWWPVSGMAGELLQFNALINDVDDWLDSTPAVFEDDTKLGVMFNVGMQGYCSNRTGWRNWLMGTSQNLLIRDQCKAGPFGWTKPCSRRGWGQPAGSSFAEHSTVSEDPGGHNMTRRQECIHAAKQSPH